jgi:hypothetical protein
LKKEKTLATGARVYRILFFFQVAVMGVLTTISGFLSSLLLGLIGNTDDLTILIIQCVITGLIVLNGIAIAFGSVFAPQDTASSSLAASRQYSGLAKELIIEIKSYEVMFAGMSDVDISKFSSPDVGVSRTDLNRFDLESQSDRIADQSRYRRYSIDPEHFTDQQMSTLDNQDIPHTQQNEINDNLVISFETYKNRLLYYSTREQLITANEPGLVLIGYWGNKTVFDKTYVSNVLSQKDLQFFQDYVNGLENSHEKRKMKKIITRLFLHMGRVDN